MQIVFDLFNFNFTYVHFSCRFLCTTNFHVSHVSFLGFFFTLKTNHSKCRKKMIIMVVHLAEEKVVVIDAS